MELVMLIAAVFLLIFSGFDVYGNKEKAADMDNSGIRPKDQRLLLNDPSTLLKEIEALKIEMTSLKSHMATQDAEVTTLNTKINTLNTEMNSKNTELNSVNTELSNVNADVTKLKAEVLTQRTLIQSLQSRKEAGSIYTVWGKKACPAVNGTSIVYTGITGGKPYHEVGGGVDTLCLPHDPDDAPSDFPTRLESAAHLYGSEYQFNYRKFAEDDDVPCAVCHVQSSGSVMMIPAKNTCPSGWNLQYHGFLVTDNDDSGWYAFDFVCLHEDSEYLTEGARQHNQNGHILYPVTAVCGSLPCPPYRNGQYITCVVCTL
ncbi:uncharacterized protein [Magallana gigas]|uniref:uncharacterized protein n=1 Tax=Magallana gigas TaxID=29159 RepID=UPI0033413945